MSKIVLSPAGSDTLLAEAERGYEAPYKEERMGHLLGRRTNGTFLVTRVKPYRGGEKTRTKVSYDDEGFTNRGRALARSHGLTLLGGFHSHVEIGGTSCSGLSEDDLQAIRDEPGEIEILVSIAVSNDPGRKPVKGSKSLYFFDPEKSYRFVIKGYAKTGRGVKWVKVAEQGRR